MTKQRHHLTAAANAGKTPDWRELAKTQNFIWNEEKPVLLVPQWTELLGGSQTSWRCCDGLSPKVVVEDLKELRVLKEVKSTFQLTSLWGLPAG